MKDYSNFFNQTIYLYIDHSKKQIYEFDAISLFNFYKYNNLINPDDYKYNKGFDIDFVDVRIAAGDPLYRNKKPSEIEKGLSMRLIKNSKGQTFFSIEDAVLYAKENKLSAASDGVIRSNIRKNLDGKQKQAYGINWFYSEEPADLSTYKYTKDVTPPKFFIPGSPFCSISRRKDWTGSYPL